jgi:hypothetical protein
MAVAQALVVSALHRLSRNDPDREVGASSVDTLRRQQTVDRLIRRIEHLGYRVSLEPVTAA